VRILSAVNLRFPEEGSSSQGESGPKARPKGVADGQSVEIQIPPASRLSEVGGRKGRPSGRWNGLSKRAGCIPGKSGVREPET